MGAQGQLTADKVAQAILYAKKKIDWQFEKMPLTVGQAMQVAENAYKQGVYEFERDTGLFSGIAHMIVNAVSGIQNNLKWLAGTVGGAKNMINLFAATLIAMAATLAIINLTKIISAFRALAIVNIAAMGKFAVIAAAILVLILAIQDLYVWINGGDSLIGRWLGSWDNVKTTLSNIFGPFLDSASNVIQTIGQIKTAFINFIQTSSTIQYLVDTIENAFNYIKTTIGSAFNYLAPLVISILGNIITFFGQLIDKAGGSGTVLGQVFNALVQLVSTLIGWVGLFGGVIIAVFTDAISIVLWLINQIWELLTTGGYVANALAAFFGGAFQMIADVIKFVADVLRGDFSSAVNDVESFFTDLYDMVVGVLQNIAAAIGTYILDKLTRAKNAVMDFLGWSSDTTNQAINDNRKNYNQSINVEQNFNGGTAAENSGYMQEGANNVWSDFGIGVQYNGGT